MDHASSEARRAGVQPKPGLSKPLSAIQGYGLAILAVALALGGSLLLEHFHFRNLGVSPFVLAVAVAAWFAGTWAAVLALLLSCISFDYFFVEPLYTLDISASDLPYFIVFASFASLVVWFSAVRRRIERELIQARDDVEKRSAELEASNKELEAFAYSVSHDLRAPLRHMAGFSELLQKNTASLPDEKSRRYIAVILESARRMGNLIDDLLAFSRIGRAETNKTAVSLAQLVEEAVTEVRQDIGDRNIVWKIGKLPAVYGDRSMRLALVNLISNAVKFTRTRAPAEIEIGCMNEAADQVVIFVRDNGVGFDMKYVNKLFGVFQRLHAAEAFEGTGIGLATVQRIAHRHGGRAWAEGRVDQGATFYFSLPKTQRI